MKIDTFSEALDFVLDHEGRIDEDVPGDPGGKTHWGITQDDWAAYCRAKGLVFKDVSLMTPIEVQDVYVAHYWKPMRCASLQVRGFPRTALVLFDGAVNQGSGFMAKALQRVLGVIADGEIGPKTEAALWNYLEKHGDMKMASALMVRRADRYRAIISANPVLEKFRKGWFNRLSHLQDELEAGQDESGED